MCSPRGQGNREDKSSINLCILAVRELEGKSEQVRHREGGGKEHQEGRKELTVGLSKKKKRGEALAESLNSKK